MAFSLLILLVLLLPTSLLYVRLRAGGSGIYLMAPKTLAGAYSLWIVIIALPVLLLATALGAWILAVLYIVLAILAGFPPCASSLPPRR